MIIIVIVIVIVIVFLWILHWPLLKVTKTLPA